ncbi:MAG: tRNA (uridine(34)/cytosine(34)/5-carboxymethylaminomethyluridine(34)-2'-O)-methyltransferase TrmL [Pseudomonadota bacterium]
MLRIVLYQPEIPPNTGNIMRLCANTGCSLHLIKPLGFELEDKRMRRAGLDYREFANVKQYEDLPSFIALNNNPRLFAATTRGARLYSDISYRSNDAIVFGPETRGLPSEILEELGKEHCLRIPMQPNSRSLNLSNAAAVVAYEALRQLSYPNLD